MYFWWLLVAVFVLSWVLTVYLRQYALAKNLLDIPNVRSSHSAPTPRGGGVAIVAAFSLALPALFGLGLLSANVTYALLGSGLLVAVIGFVDDHGHIAARWRLLGHFMAAAWVLYWLKGLIFIQLFGATVYLGWFGNIIAALFLVWMLNLYNFMDGIDGLASAEAITVCLGMSLIYWSTGNTDLMYAPLVLAVAVAGFLCWNFPPAQIFMGDAGSGFLGVVLAGLSLVAGERSAELLWSCVILLGIFIVDATWTLITRILRGEKVHVAHSSHAYQHAARYSSHKTVTMTVVAANALWLVPISLLVATGVLEGVVGVLIAYFPIGLLVHWLKRKERS